MTEWGVVGVLITMVGLILAVTTPLLKLNTNITTLTAAVAVLQKNLGELVKGNSDSHEKLWDRSREQEKTLTSHETRISVIEDWRDKGAN
ncbi:hypothetical protein SAMN02745823_02549 [Sporobacter termitidis DSM 10068]|uniref:Uncharacterized protein n=1 Tax=Sporobacter termitidis DSM 10068 TaxID=1123282 RepID=A0A1M5YHT6_9FIRM|nr:hypothetical protein [Sporobacter termitidis]SHI11522.1 hypothetical protein SAMN02745823_02549 [Sporobacter termitidis DSM 10068]